MPKDVSRFILDSATRRLKSPTSYLSHEEAFD